MRLQQRCLPSGHPKNRGRFGVGGWFASTDNGWPCCLTGHSTPEQAVRHLQGRLR